MSWENILKIDGLGQQVANLEEAELWLKFLAEKSPTMREILDETDLNYSGYKNFFELADDNLVINTLRAGIKEYEDTHLTPSQSENPRIKQLIEFLDATKRIIGGLQ